MRRAAGFTLVELLVAIAVMALLAIMSWRGLDGMARAQEQTRARSDDLLVMQAALSQWAADLDAVQAIIEDLNLDASVRESIAREAWQLGDHPLVGLFDRALGTPARFDAPYWMESALWEAAGVPTVVCGPAGGGLQTDVEWVELGQLTRYTDALREIIRAWPPSH